MKIKATFHDDGKCPESIGYSRSNFSPEAPNNNGISDPNSPDASASSPVMTTKKLGPGQDRGDDMSNNDIPTLIMATPNSTAHTEISGHTNETNEYIAEDGAKDVAPNTREFLNTITVPPLLFEKRAANQDAKMSFIPSCRPLQLHRRKINDSSISFPSAEASTDAAGAAAKSSSSFACLDEFSDDDSSHSTSSSISTASSSSSTASKSDASVMSSDSSSSGSLISRCSSLSDDGDAYDEDKTSGESSGILGSLVPSSNTSSSSGVGMKKTSTARLHRRERMQAKKTSTAKKIARRESMKLRSRDRYLRKMAMKGEVDYSYLKENEMRARNVARGAGTVAKPRGLCHETRRHILFEVFYSLPAAMTMLAFCCTHVAIYEFVQIAVADCLELNEYYNQTLVYICVFAVAVLLARISGSLYEFTSDEAYSNIKFDMSNKLKLGDLDARTLRRIKNYPTAKLLLDVTALYLTYISANHFMTETLLKTFFDNKEDVLEDLPSMKYPGISTHISNILLHGEEMFEDPSVVLGEETSAGSSTACAVLGGDLCDERVFQACNALDEFRANLTVADGEYLYDEVCGLKCLRKTCLLSKLTRFSTELNLPIFSLPHFILRFIGLLQHILQGHRRYIGWYLLLRKCNGRPPCLLHCWLDLSQETRCWSLGHVVVMHFSS